MMKLLLPFLNKIGIILIGLSCLYCHSQKYTPENFSGKQLIFGNGGGFTGKITQYTLLQNGQLFITNSVTQETKETGKVSRQYTNQLFKQARDIAWGKHKLKEPGNIYYFVKLKEDRFIQEATWGSSQHQVPKEIQELYDQLLTTVSNNP